MKPINYWDFTEDTLREVRGGGGNIILTLGFMGKQYCEINPVSLKDFLANMAKAWEYTVAEIADDGYSFQCKTFNVGFDIYDLGTTY